MFIKVVGGVVAVLLAGCLFWQHGVIRQLRSDVARLSQKPIVATQPLSPLDVEARSAKADAQTVQPEMQSLKVRIVALESRVQALSSELEQAQKQRQVVAARDTSGGRETLTGLKEQILDATISWRERFRAFRSLAGKGLADAPTTVAFADEVMALNQDDLAEELFRALDNTGNLAAAPALIKGLQSGNAELRMLALDALSEMQSDATVVPWLQHVARSDSQDRVRAEAARVLAQAGNKP
jgi:HEAT repeat protein